MNKLELVAHIGVGSGSVGEEFALARQRKREADYEDARALDEMLRRSYAQQRRRWAETLRKKP